VKHLIENGANVNLGEIRTVDDWTPLHYAVSFVYADTESLSEFAMVRLLVDHGADVNQTDGAKRTPIYLAKRLDVIKFLVENGAYVKDVKDTVPIISCVLRNNAPIEVIQYLLEQGAKVTDRKYDFLSSVISDRMRSAPQKMDLVKLLVDNGADVNSTDVLGNTPIFAASYNGDLKMVKYLVSKGATLNLRNTSNETALSYACRYNASDLLNVVKYLWRKGVAITYPKDTRFPLPSPLHTQARLGNLEVVKFLVENGEDINANYLDDTPLDIAKKEKNKPVIEYLTKLESAPCAASRVSPLAEHFPEHIATTIARMTLTKATPRAEFDKLTKPKTGGTRLQRRR
jgi:serine/threonine-protein phosphatase 6 regulatory ankyrin repeat subunit B